MQMSSPFGKRTSAKSDIFVNKRKAPVLPTPGQSQKLCRPGGRYNLQTQRNYITHACTCIGVFFIPKRREYHVVLPNGYGSIHKLSGKRGIPGVQKNGWMGCQTRNPVSQHKNMKPSVTTPPVRKHCRHWQTTIRILMISACLPAPFLMFTPCGRENTMPR